MLRPGAPLPEQAELDQAWLANLGVVGEFSNQERYVCQQMAVTVG